MINIKASKKIAQSQLNKLKRSGREYRKEELYQDTLKLQREVNARLKSLSRHHKKGTWASKILVNKLDKETIKALDTKGRVNIKPTMNITKLSNINKTLRNFLSSKTSTHAGIKEQTKATLKGIKKKLDVDDEEAELLYSMFGDESMNWLIAQVGASEAWATVMEAKEANDSQDDFIMRLQSLGINSPDEEIRMRAISIYNQYVIK